MHTVRENEPITRQGCSCEKKIHFYKFINYSHYFFWVRYQTGFPAQPSSQVNAELNTKFAPSTPGFWTVKKKVLWFYTLSAKKLIPQCCKQKVGVSCRKTSIQNLKHQQNYHSNNIFWPINIHITFRKWQIISFQMIALLSITNIWTWNIQPFFFFKLDDGTSGKPNTQPYCLIFFAFFILLQGVQTFALEHSTVQKSSCKEML